MEKKLIVYENLRTKTSFNFKNKKAELEYWDVLLKENTLRYKNEFNRYMQEKLHVIYSFSQIFRYFTAGCILLLVFAISMQNPNLIMFNSAASIIFASLYGIFTIKARLFSKVVFFVEAVNTIEFIEMMQEMVNKTE